MKGQLTRSRRLPGLAIADGLIRHPFDAANGVRTSGLVAGRHLKSGHRHDRYATAYYGVAPSVFASLVRRWAGTLVCEPIEEFSFVDLGAGMGRAVLLAAEMPFRQVIGVELNPTLARIARRNLAIWRRTGRARTTARICCRDAAEFALPAGPCLIFLFNPFAAAVLRRVVGGVTTGRSSANRRRDFLYVNNEQEGEFENRRGLNRLFLGQVRRSRADAIADHAILANQPDGEYASANYEDCSIWRWRG
jgi:SAM-dependent methyltransferase